MNNDGTANVFDTRIKPENLAVLVGRFGRRELNNAGAKQVFGEMYRSGADADDVIEQQGLQQVSDTSELDPVADEVIQANPSAGARLPWRQEDRGPVPCWPGHEGHPR